MSNRALVAYLYLYSHTRTEPITTLTLTVELSVAGSARSSDPGTQGSSASLVDKLIGHELIGVALVPRQIVVGPGGGEL